jgi:molybdopterin/thiamine biosynthesis adenylyltransferase
MLTIAGLAAIVWFGGAGLGVPRSVRLGMLVLLYLAVLLGLVISPDGLGARLGGSWGEWLLLGVVVAAALGYGRLVRYLRQRARPVDIPEQKGTFTKTELGRYARHIILREIGGPGQKRLKEARVLVIGAGGLGAPVLQYLAAAGVGTIGVIDHDEVDNSNLQRQVIHKDAAIGTPKVFSAQAEMVAQNPAITVLPYHRRLDEETAPQLFADFDLIIDGTDNFETRYLVNRVAKVAGKPLISGALSQWEGQVSLFDPAKGSPCYQCVFPDAPAPGLAPSCAEAGVIGPLPGVIGSIMALEAVKYLAGAGETLVGRMLIYDALYAETRIIGLSARPDCPVCGTKTD